MSERAAGCALVGEPIERDRGGHGSLAIMISRVVAVAVGFVLLGALLVLSFQLGSQRGGSPEQVPEDFAAVSDLYQRLQTEAADPPDDEKLVEGALQGMVDTLEDPYAAYYNPEAFTSFHEMLEGSFSGVGVMIEETPEGVTIVNVMEESPAAEAGLQSREVIVSVDGEDVSDAPLEAVAKRVQGEPGTTVTLGLEGGPQGPREVTVERAEIDRPVLRTERLDENTAHLQVLSFTEKVGERVRSEVKELHADGVRGIVVDVRGNPGGLLREAVAVTSVFIEDGPVVSVKERGQEREVFEATGDAFDDVSLAVLVDEGSASASEILAGAVQDRERGRVIGTTTFGKGTVQTVRQLSGGYGVKFTTAEYLTPSGRSIEGSGISPDQQVADAEEQLAAAREALRAQMARDGEPLGSAALPTFPVAADAA